MRSSKPSTTIGVPTDLEFVGEHIEEEVVNYDGGNFVAVDTIFVNSKFVLTGAAANTLIFMKIVERASPGVIDKWLAEADGLVDGVDQTTIHQATKEPQ